MYFEDLHALLTMGGHGAYVWAAYASGFAVLTWNLLTPLGQRRMVVGEIQRRARRKRAQQEALK